MARHKNSPREVGCCPHDGKVCYADKASAKLAIKTMPARKGHLNSYRCGEFWHIGRMPERLASGEITRDEIGPTHQRPTYDYLNREAP